MKSTVHSFKLKNDSDLFGLGLEETGPKESSEEGKGHPVSPLADLICQEPVFFQNGSRV